MTDEIQQLITSLRTGDYEDPAEKISVLAAALVEQKADIAFLESLLAAPQVSLRLAAMEACRARTEPELLFSLIALSVDLESRVRQKLAEILSGRFEPEAVEALGALTSDADRDVRAAAFRATTNRAEFVDLQERALTHDSDWTVRYAAVQALTSHPGASIVETLARVLQNDDDSDVGRRCAEAVERHMETSPTETEPLLPSGIAALTQIGRRLKGYGVQSFPLLSRWLEERTSSMVDPATLSEYGTDLTALALKGALPRAYEVDDDCEAIVTRLRQSPPRSMALLGPAGVGKSALVNELTYRLAQPENGGWRVLRMSPTDFMAGTKYLGEWESKVRNLIDAIRQPRRALLYVPNLSELSAAGVWSKSDSSVATALAPYLEESAIVVLGESTPEEYERGLGRIPSLRRLFDRIIVPERSADRTRAILSAIRDDAHSRIPDEMLDRMLDVSGQFLGHISRPGNAVELLRLAIKSEEAQKNTPDFRDILDLLSASTGIPADLLDDTIPLKQDETRAFFEARVVGQPKAVEAMVDLVTLIKAGVTDPNRPFGVFLFSGPTGVGKTELARALAEFIFGDVNRLKRFDMSEYANPDSFTRLIGTPQENGLLTDAVRQHPFSVVLLDEIEKSHLNVFDLCLQIFDAGRLTDGRGRTVDFRRTIIVLTSNVGATTGVMGFGADESEPGKSVRDRMPRELSRFFRPEFLNRFDRIIQFRPLSLEVAEQIARREIQSVLERQGIRSRRLVVDVDPGVVSLAVREGYSAQFGARPLKRTVERLLLVPIAKVIAGGSLQPGAVLRLTQRAGRVHTNVTAPPKAMVAAASAGRPGAESHDSRLSALSERMAALEGAIEKLNARKSELIAETRDPAFARSGSARSSVLNDIHNIDEFLTHHRDIGAALRSRIQRARRHPAETVTQHRDEIERLEREVERLTFVAGASDPSALGDALVIVSLVDRKGEAQGATEKIAGMYRALATRLRMTAETLGEFHTSGKEDRVYLLIAGLGAFGTLRGESGLHRFDRRYKQRAARSGREVILEDRELIRVDVHPAPPEPGAGLQKQTDVRVVPIKPPKKRLIKSDYSVKLFHQPSLRSIELWTTGPREAALSRGLSILAVVLADDHDSGTNRDGIVREYDVGIGSRVKDLRSGIVTTRINNVLKGELEAMLAP
ncbi:MAG TPA: AAA family ATPase [Terriglobia bacterium]|nr:AAA family ATPase [Terriglobia bacterium]